MAQGEFLLNRSSDAGSYLEGKITWESVLDTPSNTSSVHAKIYIRKDSTISNLTVPTEGNWTYSITVDGVTTSGTIRKSVLKEFVELGTITVSKIEHNTDGTKTVAVSGTVSGPYGSSFGGHTTSGSQSITLDTNERDSSISVSVGTADIGTSLQLTVQKAWEDAMHSLSYSFRGQVGVIAGKTSDPSVTWDIPMELCQLIPDAQSAECVITVTTYAEATVVGHFSASITLCVPQSVGLDISTGWASVQPQNAGTSANDIGLFIQGYSKAMFSFDASKISTANSYGAGIQEYRVLLAGMPYDTEPNSPSITTAMLSTAGQRTAVCTVTDSRGKEYSTEISFFVYEYFEPGLSQVKAFRCNAEGKEDPSGTYISVTALASYSSLNGQNSAVLSTRYMRAGGEYGEPQNIASGSAAVIGGGQIDRASSYRVEVSVVDALKNAASLTILIPTVSVAFNLREGGNGGAFGKYCENEKSLEIPADWVLRIGNTTINESQLEAVLGFGDTKDADGIRY